MTNKTTRAIAADVVFDGENTHAEHAVVFSGADIIDVKPREDVVAVPTINLPPGMWLSPGFIDVQVNGGGDVLFNNVPTPEGIAAIVAAHRRFGTTALLPTLISDTAQTMRAARDAVSAASATMPEVLGIHFEGPFLSPERPGVHDKAVFRQPSEADVAVLKGRPGDLTLVTLAPECVPHGFIAHLCAAGLRVALGHSRATYEETLVALAEGMTGFTHLFNAMRPLGSRDPGPIAAALEEPRAFYGLIVDGEHVAPATLRLALRGAGQAMLVTDAMPPVGGNDGPFMLAGQQIGVSAGRCTTADGTLAGSVLDMASAVRNCVGLLRLNLAAALRLATAAPAAFLGRSNRHGHLAPGCRADFVALDPHTITVRHVWVAGAETRVS
ncbi:MAG: N-acetylglucosamine-6-phosphate deacetylase [Alphaproteobacteria bacterium]|nr:N-acetylglucosamine-6-phosphate deacetylase [Alphaproteobacteria bacterium]